ACWAAAAPKRLLRPEWDQRWVSGIQRSSSNPFTWAANVVGKRRASKWEIGPTPLRPSSWASIIALTLSPTRVMAPLPVITTLLRMAAFLPALLRPGVSSRRLRDRARLPTPHHHRPALTHLGEADLHGVRLLHRPRLDRHPHRALRVRRAVVAAGRQRAAV